MICDSCNVSQNTVMSNGISPNQCGLCPFSVLDTGTGTYSNIPFSAAVFSTFLAMTHYHRLETNGFPLVKKRQRFSTPALIPILFPDRMSGS